MAKKLAIMSALLGVMSGVSANASVGSGLTATQEIDLDVWSVIVNTVANHDIGRQGDAYSRDAILVIPKGTKKIAKALEKWGQDMVEAQAKGDTATVAFRFSHRQDNAETAFESGIFKYTEITKSGTKTSMYVPFEQLLLKKNGKWRITMEHQFPDVAQGDWDKLPPQ